MTSPFSPQSLLLLPTKLGGITHKEAIPRSFGLGMLPGLVPTPFRRLLPLSKHFAKLMSTARQSLSLNPAARSLPEDQNM